MLTLLAIPLRGSRFGATFLTWLTSILFAILFVTPSFGQATEFAASRHVRLEGFGAFSYVSPAYRYDSPDPGKDYGIVAGADVDIAAHIWVQPGVEVRTTLAKGPVTNQYSFGGGPRIIAPFTRIQPYADFLLSGGKIEFSQGIDPSYLSDQSSVYSFGGGADLVLSRGWAVKVDVQSQRWRLTHLQAPFHPLVVSIGFRYEFHGGKHSAPSR